MPRPRKRRRVGFMPRVTYFQPVGLDEQLQEVIITLDEIEALRLKDLEGLDQETCAAEMNIAQSTYQRILASARKKLSRAIMEGRAIRIEGGDYRLIPYQLECENCGYGWMPVVWPVHGGGNDCPRCGGKGRRWRGGWNDQ